MSDVDPARFRQLLGRFATGVTIVTADDSAGNPTGMTANTLTSVSLNPPLISICIDHSADMHHTLQHTTRFTVNILSANQEAISRRFAEQGTSRFDGIGFSRSDRGGIILDGVLAHIECERISEFPTGDHSLFVARVVGGSTSEGEPLLYYRGGYAGMARG
jgi:3-hydroxy-9,10-secoandrosta-1,3,5(10)-triene-9,17-dione monooxygenase reductase component